MDLFIRQPGVLVGVNQQSRHLPPRQTQVRIPLLMTPVLMTPLPTLSPPRDPVQIQTLIRLVHPPPMAFPVVFPVLHRHRHPHGSHLSQRM
jgi:hypothetical protein